MSQDDIKETMIVTPFGMFKFLCLPFGLRNAGNNFQMMMDHMLGDLPFCFLCVDNILIFSPDLDTHVHQLCKVFEMLCLYSLTIGLPKCVLAIPRTSALKFWLFPIGKAHLRY